VLIQLLLPGRGALLAIAFPVLMVLSIATLFAGNFLALQQSNVKRLLGYSGVAHVGFLMLALCMRSELALAMLLFYAVAYTFTNMGAFLVVHAVRAGGGGDDSIGSFDGLVRRNGWLALAMLVFLLSLAGIPFAVGFWAKLYVFLAIWQAGFHSLVLLGALISVLALFYYLRVVRAMFMNAPEHTARIEVDLATNAGIAVCMAAVLGIGVWPGPLLDAAMAAATGFLSR
jgi:NADH-quinone oxidoreductase subunit N